MEKKPKFAYEKVPHFTRTSSVIMKTVKIIAVFAPMTGFLFSFEMYSVKPRVGSRLRESS